MSVDPTDPETFEDDIAEEEHDVEAPEADAAEQQTELLEQRDNSLSERDPEKANPADAAEQARVVEIDEDEYR